MSSCFARRSLIRLLERRGNFSWWRNYSPRLRWTSVSLDPGAIRSGRGRRRAGALAHTGLLRVKNHTWITGGKNERNKVLKREDPENDTGLFEVGFKSRQKIYIYQYIMRSNFWINTPNWVTGTLCSGIRRVGLLTQLLRINNGVINRICSTGHSPGQLLGYK